MASPIHAVLADALADVLTDPDQAEEPDLEVRHADSFLRVRAEETPARRAESEPPHEAEAQR